MQHRASFYEKYIKRALDILLSGCAIIVLCPVMAITALFVLLRLGRPVLYSAVRIGKGEKPFNMYKFRTMTNECGQDGQLLPDRLRLTTFGNFLRATSLDELPELLSVFTGKMSLIGPRPLPVSYLPYFSDEESLRHSVRGGMSGLAQINGRASIAWNQKFRYDVEYVKQISFRLDMIIFIKTIISVFRRDDIGSPSTNTNLYDERPVQRPELVINEVSEH